MKEEDIPSNRVKEQTAPAGRRFRTLAQEATPAANESKSVETKTETQKENECPSGGIFGKDADKIPGCRECLDELWQRCAKLTEAAAAPAEGERRLQRNV